MAASAVGICSLHTWHLLHGTGAFNGPLAEFAWRCLEALPPARGGEAAYACDELAAALTPEDPERGLRLLGRLLAQPYGSDSWNPLDWVSDRGFWHALSSRDRDRALRLALAQATTLSDHLDMYLRELIDQIQDAPLLVDFAIEAEAHALLVGEIITAAHPGYWPIAFRILEHYPANAEVRAVLSRGARREVGMISGPLSAHYTACRQDVERMLQEPRLSLVARDWLADLERSLRAEIERERRRESDDRVNRWRSVRDDPAAPERRWALQRLAAMSRHDLVASNSRTQ
jgi:hypothetical protein